MRRRKKLLRHWWRADRETRRLFFCQLEAVETIIYLQEILALGKRPRWNSEADAGRFPASQPGQKSAPR